MRAPEETMQGRMWAFTSTLSTECNCGHFQSSTVPQRARMAKPWQRDRLQRPSDLLGTGGDLIPTSSCRNYRMILTKYNCPNKIDSGKLSVLLPVNELSWMFGIRSIDECWTVVMHTLILRSFRWRDLSIVSGYQLC